MSNPLANPDQFAAEADVRAILASDAIEAAVAIVGNRFRLAYGTDVLDGAEPHFEAAMREFVTNYAFKAAASESAHPRFVRDFMPAYDWHGTHVPGARMGGDNPDNCYRLAGIAHGGHYRVTARPVGPVPANTSFTLVGNFGTSDTIQTIETAQIVCEADGSFVLTIDGTPADGRDNHLTTAPRAKFLFVRESFENWATETSYDLSIDRLDPVDAAPLTRAEMAERAAFRAVEDVPLYYWFHRLFSGLERNTIRLPSPAGSVGGLVTQAGVQGWFTLADDEVVLVRANTAGAAYVAFQCTDWWFRSIDAHERSSSLTRQQCQPDPDGTLSAVIAPRDPGVVNWLDTGGLATSLFLARWQGLPSTPVDGGPTITARLLNRRDLPQDFLARQAIDDAGRAALLAERKSAWSRRIEI
ncbi:hypothetical protein [Novosphingobium malaysiense]|uniref:DUF1214 domain-containing protein n=1 Tax=Novosphingobium malaysiense TaxID=1348853 RepID=A0A0B1ZIM9_9SPHN|nr:hypothetical protein [Novosphingobium malaysiense]KHK89182.1 hypothetical protein LK12_21925 [Novosphingobium malaysiense]